MNIDEIEGQTTIEEQIPDECYSGKVREVMLNGTYFVDSTQRIRNLEAALIWAADCKELMATPEAEKIITPLIENDLWF